MGEHWGPGLSTLLAVILAVALLNRAVRLQLAIKRMSAKARDVLPGERLVAISALVSD